MHWQLPSCAVLASWVTGAYSPTELSQQLRHITAEYEMTFFAGDLVESNSFRSAYQFQVPYTVAQTKVHAGTLPAEKSWLTWEGERMMFSNLKEKKQKALTGWHVLSTAPANPPFCVSRRTLLLKPPVLLQYSGGRGSSRNCKCRRLV